MRFALFLALAICAPGQTARKGAALPPSPTATFDVDVSAVDADGRPVVTLAPADFAVTVDGQTATVAGVRLVTQHPRRIVLIVDDARITASGVDRLRSELARFVSEEMKEDDEAAIVRTSSGQGALETMTADRKLLGQSIADIQFDPAQGSQSEEYVLTGMATAFRQTLAGLAAIPGRKSVVLLSENLAAAGKHPERFASMVLLAANASAVLYSLDLNGSREKALLTFPGETGGINLGTDLQSGLTHALRDQSDYYLLSVASTSGTIAVKAGGAAKAIRFRTSPLMHRADMNFPGVATAPGVAGELAPSLKSGGIRAQVTPVFGSNPALGLIVTAVVWIEAGDLTFTHQLNGIHRADAELTVAALGGDGTVFAQTEGHISLQLNGDQYQSILRDGWVGQLTLHLRSGGSYQVRAAVLDDASSRSGSANRLMELPNVSGGQLALSSIALQRKDSKTVAESPARRLFAAGDRLAFSYQVLNAEEDPQKAADLEATLRLFRGGDLIFEGAPETLPVSTTMAHRIRSMSGELTLGPKLTAGRYNLQVLVVDRGQQRRAEQWADFQIRPPAQ